MFALGLNGADATSQRASPPTGAREAEFGLVAVVVAVVASVIAEAAEAVAATVPAAVKAASRGRCECSAAKGDGRDNSVAKAAGWFG
jgi:hypothetical protein